MMRNKRGQAALEFLTTYGWAFLVILVMIGALAYFGVLDPSRFVSQRCQVGAPLGCDGENYVLSTTQMNLSLRNSLNEQYSINGIEIKGTDGAFRQCTGGGDSGIVNIGGTVDLRCNLPSDSLPALTVGKKARLEFQVLYNSGTAPSAIYQKTVAGEVYANVQ